MALDNAQFMSELSITDPPGTDPLSEGDDQIRTSKRTQLQSFPNVDKAVTKTADQLNDVAQISEVNVFSAQNAFLEPIQGADGLAGFPGYTFSTAPDMGMFKFGTDQLGFSVGAVEKIIFTTNTIIPKVSVVQIRPEAPGTVALPMYSFNNDTGMGMYRGGAGLLDFAVTGVHLFTISAAATVSKASYLGRDASITNPSYAFENELGTGFFRSATGEMSFTANAVVKFVIKPNTINMNLPVGNAGLGTGDLFRSVSAPGFVEIV